MSKIPVVLEDYNQEVLEKGLGVKISELSEEQLSKVLSHALGYVDYTDSNIASELKEIAGIEEPKSFYELYKAGEVDLEKIHDYIDNWHEGDSEKELYEFLGLTKEQYFKFAENEDSLKLL